MQQQKALRTVKLQPKYRIPDYRCFPRKETQIVPWLNVSGNWLEDAGFRAGDYIDISVGKNELIIRKARKKTVQVA